MKNSVKNSKFPSWGMLLSGKFVLVIPHCDLHVTTAGCKATCGFGIREFPVELSGLFCFFTHAKKAKRQTRPHQNQ